MFAIGVSLDALEHAFEYLFHWYAWSRNVLEQMFGIEAVSSISVTGHFAWARGIGH